MENKQGKKFTTTQHVKAQIGISDRTYPFLHCSMSKITEVHTHAHIILISAF